MVSILREPFRSRLMGGLITGLVAVAVATSCLASGPFAASTVSAAEPAGPPRMDAFGVPLPPGAVTRIGVPRLQHPNTVSNLSFSDDGRLLASSCYDRQVRIWDIQAPNPVQLIKPADDDPPGSICFSSDAKLIAISYEHENHLGEIRICKLTGELLKKIPTLGHSGSSMAFADNDKQLVVIGRGIAVFEVATGEEVWEPSASSRACAVGRNGVAAVQEVDGKVYIKDALENKLISTVTVPHGPIDSISISGDASRLAVTSGKRVIVYDTKTNRELFPPFECRSEAHGVVISPDGRFVVGFASDATAQCWELKEGRREAEIDNAPRSSQTAQFSLDGRSFAYAKSYDTIDVWDTRTWKRVTPAVGSIITSLDWSRDGNQLATIHSRGTVRVWDSVSGELSCEIAPSQEAFSVKFLNPTKRGHTALALFETSAVEIVGSTTGERDRWVGFEGMPDESFIPPEDRPIDQSFSPGGRRVAALYRDHIDVRDVETGRLVGSFKPTAALPAGTFAAAFNPDGSYLAIARSGARAAVVIWNPETGTIAELDKGTDALGKLAFSCDGQLLAAAGAAHRPGQGLKISFWEVASGNRLASIESPEDEISRLAFSPDGWLFATNGATVATPGNVRILDLASQAELACYGAHPAELSALEFSPNGKRLAACGESGTATVCSVPSRPRPQRRDTPNAANVEAQWQKLSGTAPGAFAAEFALAEHGDMAVAFLETRMNARSLSPTEDQQARSYLREFIADDGPARALARISLLQFGSAVEPFVRESVSNTPTAAVRKKVAQLLDDLRGPIRGSPDDLRITRTIRVLELIGNAKALECLRIYSAKLPENLLTISATEAADRVQRRLDSR